MPSPARRAPARRPAAVGGTVRRAVRRALGLASVAALAGCESPARPVVAVISSGSFVDAARLAVEEAARDGALPPIDTLMLDESGGSADEALRLAGEATRREGLVAVVGHSNSSASLATAQAYNDAEVVQLTPTSTADLYSQAGPFSFRLVPPDSQQASVLAREVQRLLPTGGRLALLWVNDDYGRGLRERVLRELDTTRHHLLVDLPHVEQDLRPEVMEETQELLRRARPQLVLWLGRPPTLHAMLPGWRGALGAVSVLSGDAMTTWRGFDTGDGRFAGVRYIDFADLRGTPELTAFASRFRARFGREPGSGEALTYDAMRLVLDAIASGARSGDAVRLHLVSLGEQRPAARGLTGEIRFTERGDVMRSPVVREVPAPEPTP